MIIFETVWFDVNKPDISGPTGILSEMVEAEMFTPGQVAGMNVGDTIYLDWSPLYPGKSEYHQVRVTKHEVASYICNCCQTEQPGSGAYDICHNCGWENEPGETNYPDQDGGPNHMSLNEGRANFAKRGHYKCTKGCMAMYCMCD